MNIHGLKLKRRDISRRIVYLKKKRNPNKYGFETEKLIKSRKEIDKKIRKLRRKVKKSDRKNRRKSTK